MKKVLILEDHAGTRKALEVTVRKVDASAQIFSVVVLHRICGWYRGISLRRLFS